MSRGFDSPGVWVRLPDAPGGKKVRSGKSDGVGSPERSLSSPDSLIAGMRIILKRGIFLRGNYDSADYGSVAQLVERLAVNQNVKGSSPFGIASSAFLYAFLVRAVT